GESAQSSTALGYCQLHQRRAVRSCLPWANVTPGSAGNPPGCSSSTRRPPSLSAEPDGCPCTTSPAMTVCQAAHEARFGYKNKHFPCWTRGVKPGSAYYEDPGSIPLTACRAALPTGTAPRPGPPDDRDPPAN